MINDIPFGHKFAIRDIRMCDYVVKYGHVIGRAKRDIRLVSMFMFTMWRV